MAAPSMHLLHGRPQDQQQGLLLQLLLRGQLDTQVVAVDGEVEGELRTPLSRGVTSDRPGPRGRAGEQPLRPEASVLDPPVSHPSSGHAESPTPYTLCERDCRVLGVRPGVHWPPPTLVVPQQSRRSVHSTVRTGAPLPRVRVSPLGTPVPDRPRTDPGLTAREDPRLLPVGRRPDLP